LVALQRKKGCHRGDQVKLWMSFYGFRD
jgi:hypothetical protein